MLSRLRRRISAIYEGERIMQHSTVAADQGTDFVTNRVRRFSSSAKPTAPQTAASHQGTAVALHLRLSGKRQSGTGERDRGSSRSEQVGGVLSPTDPEPCVR